MSFPPIYKVYQEYKKQKNERNLNMMKYQYEFMQTIVEAIKTVSFASISTGTFGQTFE